MYSFPTPDLNKPSPIILGIESSCDETAAAVISGRKILSDEIASVCAREAISGNCLPRAYGRDFRGGFPRGEERGDKF